MPDLLTIVLSGLTGFCIGGIMVKSTWKRNADNYIGKDNMKVIHLEFYDSELAKRYIAWLVTKLHSQNKETSK